jgi:type IV secretory pathway VirB10-like protein
VARDNLQLRAEDNSSSEPRLAWGRMVAIAVVIFGALGLWILWSLHPAQKSQSAPREATITHTSGTAKALKDLIGSYQGVPDGVPAPVVVTQAAPAPPADHSKDEEIRRLQLQVYALQEAMKQKPPPAKPTTTPVVKPPEDQEAKRRKEEERKAEEGSRKLVVWRAKEEDKKRGGRVEIEMPESPYTLSAGWAVQCTVESRVNSDLQGPMIARVREPVYSSATGEHLLIPEGSVFVGERRGAPIFGESRLDVQWSTLTFPDASQITFRKPMTGGDGIGQAGLTGTVDNHWLRLFGSIILTGVLRGGTQAVGGGFASGTAERVGSTVAQEGSSEGTSRVRQILSSKPTIVVEEGSPCTILLQDRLSLPSSYQGS